MLAAAFGTISVLLMVAQFVGYLQWRSVQANVDLIEHNALASIRLVQRMSLDVQRKRILVDRHIYEHEPVHLRELETRIVATDDDYTAAARAYAPLATFEGEATSWNQLTLDDDALAPRLDMALALSRQNRDADAREVIAAAEPTYDAVERDANVLVAINQRSADQAMITIGDLEENVLTLRLGFALVVLALTVMLGVWVTRTLRRREAQIDGYAVTLENRNRELDAFAGRVAHDLRGPLNTIKMAGSLLAEQVPGEARTGTILQRGVARMEQLIGDLLTLSRIDGQALGMVARADVVATALADDLAPRVQEVGGTLAIELQPARVRCGEGLLRQVLWNLGENAVKYRRPDVALAIELRGRPTRREYEIRTSDNGTGMSPDEVHGAFEPFFRGNHATSIPGTGLGLAIVRRIVEASGGTVHLESAVDRGTTITIRLPLAS